MPGQDVIYFATDGGISKVEGLNQVLSTSKNDELLAFNVYPNPASEYVEIDLGREYGDVEIQIINMTGKVQMHSKLSNIRAKKINVNNLPKGVYVLHVKSDLINCKHFFDMSAGVKQKACCSARLHLSLEP